MVDISKKEQEYMHIFLQKEPLSSSDVHGALNEQGRKVSLVTVKRMLSSLVKKDVLNVSGTGPSTAYTLSVMGRLFADVDAYEYCNHDPDTRQGKRTYTDDLFKNLPDTVFTDDEMAQLEEATAVFRTRSKRLSPTLAKKELERLIIELSWKSSRIEGNTYTLLDTERLILESKEAAGHSKDEAHMILNHKDAFLFVRDEIALHKHLTRTHVENMHGLLVKDMRVEKGLRKGPVGIVGSVYMPLDVVSRIEEAMDDLFAAVSRLHMPYGKALLILLGISYIQPFADGNKRTARLAANAVLLAHGCAPLSYRSVDEEMYREATLVFYELNSLVPFKKLFIEQYDFAARNYALG